MGTYTELLVKITGLKPPAIIAISGFGGCGKTSLANYLSAKIKAAIVPVDAFNKRISQYSNWDLMDYKRLENDVINPFKLGANPFTYANDIGEGTVNNIIVKHYGRLIIEGVGLLRANLMKYFDCSIWVDCPLDVAVARGKKRGRGEFHNPHDEEWEGIWKQNDLQYFEKYNLLELVDYIFSNEQEELLNLLK